MQASRLMEVDVDQVLASPGHTHLSRAQARCRPGRRCACGRRGVGTAWGCGRPTCSRRAEPQRRSSCRSPLVALPEFCNEARQPLGPDGHLQRVLPHIDALDEQLDDSRLLGREQLVPDRGEVGEQDGNLALGDLVLGLALRVRQVRAISSGAPSSFWREPRLRRRRPPRWSPGRYHSYRRSPLG